MSSGNIQKRKSTEIIKVAIGNVAFLIIQNIKQYAPQQKAVNIEITIGK